MKIEEIYSLWEKDAHIDSSQLDQESLKISLLHSKYLKLYGYERLTLKKFEADFKSLEFEKYEFYTQGPTEDHQKKGWKLPAKGMILKNEVDKYLQADKDLIEFSLKIALQREKVDLLQSIINNINSRSFQISNALKFIQWTNGTGMI